MKISKESAYLIYFMGLIIFFGGICYFIGISIGEVKQKQQDLVTYIYNNPKDYKVRVGSENGKTICYSVTLPDSTSYDFLTKEQLDSVLLGYEVNP